MLYFRIDTNEFMDADVMNNIKTLSEAMEYFRENVNYIDMPAPGVVIDISGSIYMFAGLLGEEDGIAVFMPIDEDDDLELYSPINVISNIFYSVVNGTEYILIEE